jgi:hypothetical protein
MTEELRDINDELNKYTPKEIKGKISEKTKSGMSFSPDDHKYLKLLFDREEELRKASFNEIKLLFHEQRHLITEIRNDIALVKDKLVLIEARVQKTEEDGANREARLKVVERFMRIQSVLMGVEIFVTAVLTIVLAFHIF